MRRQAEEERCKSRLSTHKGVETQACCDADCDKEEMKKCREKIERVSQ
jgi:hypothetical protein